MCNTTVHGAVPLFRTNDRLYKYVHTPYFIRPQPKVKHVSHFWHLPVRYILTLKAAKLAKKRKNETQIYVLVLAQIRTDKSWHKFKGAGAFEAPSQTMVGVVCK